MNNDLRPTRRVRMLLLALGLALLTLAAVLCFTAPPPGEHPWRDAISTP